MEGEEGSSSRWSCATNWTVAKGSSLEASISFDTSDEDAPALTSEGSLLLRPLSDDPPPCEVTVFFKGRHEIHRVYARTTARIYEIYYKKDAETNSTKEYLHTVKCGPAMPDENLHGLSQNNSVHSSEEESWVNVKAPLSALTETRMHYEATAEISDVEPCVSLTLRFLSLETKSSVHVEEIYIYADPVDESSTTQDLSSGTTASSNTSSLFAMLVPNLLQMSKSGLSSRINERYFSPDRIHDGHDVKDQNAKLDTSVTDELRRKAVNHAEEKDNTQTQKEGLPQQVEIPVATDTTEPELVQSNYSTGPHHNHARNSNDADIRQAEQAAAIKRETVKVDSTSNGDQSVINESTNCVEKILEQLVSKVEKIETYFTKFEEKMVRPISCIESRLERLENQFDLFTKDLQSLRIPLRESCSHAADEVERSQDPVPRDDFVADGVAGFEVETKTSPGTTFKAPECMTEDESDNDGHDCIDDATHDDLEADTHVPNKRKPISIDGALASALAAFATESNPTVSSFRSDKMNDPDLIEEIEQVDVLPGGPFPGGENVPHVSIDEVHIEAFFDLLSSCDAVPDNCRNDNEAEKETINLHANLHQVHATDITSEVGPTEETFECSDIHTQIKAIPGTSQNLDEMEKERINFDDNLHQVDGDITSEVGAMEGTLEDSDIHSHIEPGLFSKSVIGEVSDEDEVEPGFGPDSPRFTCNSPLSSSDFEPSFPNYGEILTGWGEGSSSSTDSSFHGSFLKTKTQIISDGSNMDSNTFCEDSQKVSAILDELKMLDPLAVLLGEAAVSEVHGSGLTTTLKESTTGANDPFIDLEELPNSTDAGPTDGNIPQFESLI